MAVSQATTSQTETDSMRQRVVALLIALHNFIVKTVNEAPLGHSGRAPVPQAAASRMGVLEAVKMVGGAVIGIAVTTLVVNEVLTVDSIANSTGPFTGVIDSITTTGVAAMTLLVIGLLVVSASYIMRYMGRF
jgi:predicted DNA repair protein MutK